MKNDGKVWAWGYNAFGQLGNGNNNSYNVPVEVSVIAEISAIKCGSNHALALKNDGTLWSWGNNSYGQLGIGNTTHKNVPVQASIAGVTAIAAGNSFSLCLKNDGTVWAWGTNSDGQLGNGGNTSSSIPVQTNSISGVIAINAGWYHSMALKQDQTMWTWGDNSHGQLGNGNTTSSSVPIQTIGLCDVLTSVKEIINDNLVSVFPNPANDYITIETSTGKLNSTYVVLNFMGQEVSTGQIINNKAVIDVHQWSPGVYILKLGEYENKAVKLLIN